MLVCTLYSNNVNNAECYRIIKLFKENILRNKYTNLAKNYLEIILINLKNIYDKGVYLYV